MKRELTDESNYSVISNYIINNDQSLKRYARKLTFPDEDEAQDLFQETAYRCLRNRHLYTDNKSADSWVKTIMRNIYINAVQCAYRRTTRLVEHCDNMKESVVAPTDECYSIEELYTAIEKLHSTDRQIILMRLRGYSYDEIATETHKKVGTIKSSIHRIKRQLRKLLDR